MKGNKLIILAVVAVVLVALAFVMNRKDEAIKPTGMGELVIPDLPVNDVLRIDVINSSNETVTVSRADDRWVSLSKYGYPADFGKVRDALIKLSEVKIGQVMNVSEDQKKAINIVTPGQGVEDAGSLVNLYGEGGKKIASVLLGKEHSRQAPARGGMMGGSFPDGRYISVDSGERIYLVSETMSEFSDDATDWLDTEIVNVKSDKIKEVTVAVPGTNTLVFTKDGSDMVLEGLADDEEMDSSKQHSIKSSLGYLRFKDVADPSLTDAQTGMTNAVIYKALTEDGVVYTAMIGGKADDDRYFRLAVALTDETEQTEDVDAAEEQEEAGSEEGEAAEDADSDDSEEKRAELEKEIADLSEKLSKWTYIIASYEADSMILKRDDVVKEKEKEEEEEPDTTEEADNSKDADDTTASSSEGAEAGPEAVQVEEPKPEIDTKIVEPVAEKGVPAEPVKPMEKKVLPEPEEETEIKQPEPEELDPADK